MKRLRPRRPFEKLRVALSNVEGRAEDMEIRGEASAIGRGDLAGSPTRQPRWGARGAPPPVQKAPAATPSRGHGNPRRGVSDRSRRPGGVPNAATALGCP